MIAKGNTHSDGAKLADYMEQSKDGERAETWQLRGFEATNIKDAFRDVQIMAGATKCEQPFFHVQLRNREGETLTRQQWEYAADRIERMLGLTGQPRAITFHTYEHNNDEHMHVAWSRIDQDTLTAKPLPFFKERLKKISRELELEFGLQPVKNEREGPIKYAPTKAQDEQARRLGVDIHEVQKTIRASYERSDCGVSFQVALEHEGMLLAQGDRRGFVVIDHEGGVHSLSKRILDVSSARVRAHLSDLALEQLPTVEEARIQQNEQINALINQYFPSPAVDELIDAFFPPISTSSVSDQREEISAPVWDRDRDNQAWQDAVIKAAIEKEKVERQFVEPRNRQAGAGSREKEAEKVKAIPPEIGKTAGEIRIAYSLTETGQEFANALEDRGFILAHVSSADAELLNQQERERLKALGREAPKQIRKGDEWMAQKGGAAAFSKTQHDSAQRSYEKWLEGRDPEDTRRPMGFEKYVDYVQERYEGASLHKYNKFRPDELVVIDRWGGIHQLTYANTGDSFKDRAAHLQDIDRSPLFNVSDARAVMDDIQQQRREEQAQRFKVELGKTESEIRLAYRLTATGQEFANALEDRGFILAQATLADIEAEKARLGLKEKWQELREGELVVINQYGNVYRLSERSTGDGWKTRQERFAEIDRAPLFSVTQGRAVAEDLRQHRRDEQAQRFKVELGKTESEIRLAYRVTATGQEFANALEDRGFILAQVTATDAEKLNRWQEAEAKEKGQQPPAEYRQYREGQLIVVNQFGNLYRLTERNTGATAKALDQRFADMDRAALSSVTKAQGAMQKLRQHRREERQEAWEQKLQERRQAINEQHCPVNPPSHQSWPAFGKAAQEATSNKRTDNLKGVTAHVWTAYQQSDNSKAFAAALDDKGIMFAVVTRDEALRSHKEAAFAREIGRYTPRFTEGEIVIVTEPRPEYRRNGEIIEPGRVHKLDQSLADKFVKALGKSITLQGIKATLELSNERTQERAEERSATLLEKATIEQTPEKPSPVRNVPNHNIKSPITALGNASVEVIGKVLDVGATAFQSLIAPTLTPEQIRQGEQAVSRREAEAEHRIDFSKYTAEMAQQRQQRENDREAERRQHRDRGGRER